MKVNLVLLFLGVLTILSLCQSTLSFKVCDSSVSDSDCSAIWFSCIQSGTSNLDEIGIEFEPPQGGPVWVVANNDFTVDPSLASSYDWISRFYVSGNGNTAVSGQYPLGQNMMACTLDPVFVRPASGPATFGAPASSDLYNGQWAQVGLGARVQGGSYSYLKRNPTVLVSGIKSPNAKFDMQTVSGNGVSLQCFASIWDPCVGCGSSQIKLSDGSCCDQGSVNWVASPPICCTGQYAVQDKCCPQAGMVLTKDGQCCASTLYNPTTQTCCGTGQVKLNNNSCCPNGAQSKDNSQCCPSVANWNIAKDTVCCADSDFIGSNVNCCDGNGETIVKNSDQGSQGVCCTIPPTTINNAQYCCQSTGFTSGQTVWAGNQCCKSSDANSDGSFCCTGKSGSNFQHVGNDYSNGQGSTACCPSNLVSVGVPQGFSACCPAGQTQFTQQSEGGAQPHACCSPSNVLNQGGNKYCCQSAPGGGDQFINGACCSAANIKNGYCCPDPSDVYISSSSPCCDPSKVVTRGDGSKACCSNTGSVATANTDCCSSSNVATIGGTKYCCGYAPNGKQQIWLNNQCCPQGQTNSAGDFCCGDITTVQGASSWESSSTSYNGQFRNTGKCCPNNYLSHNAPANDIACCPDVNDYYTVYQDWRIQDGRRQHCCPYAEALLQGGKYYCCNTDVNVHDGQSWIWDGSTCCVNSYTVTDDKGSPHCCGAQNQQWTTNQQCCDKANAVNKNGVWQCCSFAVNGQDITIINGKCCLTADVNDQGYCCMGTSQDGPYKNVPPGYNWDSVANQCCPTTGYYHNENGLTYCCGQQSGVQQVKASEGNNLNLQLCCPTASVIKGADGNNYCCANGKTAAGNTWVASSGVCCTSNQITKDASGTQYCCPTSGLVYTTNNPCCSPNNVPDNMPSHCCQGVVKGLGNQILLNGGGCCIQGGASADGNTCCGLLSDKGVTDANSWTAVQKVVWPPGTPPCCPDTYVNTGVPNGSGELTCCNGRGYSWTSATETGGESMRLCCPSANVINSGGNTYCCKTNIGGQVWASNGQGGYSCCASTSTTTSPQGNVICCASSGHPTNVWTTNDNCCDTSLVVTAPGPGGAKTCCSQTGAVWTSNNPCCSSGLLNNDVSSKAYCCPAAGEKVTTNNPCCPAANVAKNLDGSNYCCLGTTSPVILGSAASPQCCATSDLNDKKDTCCPGITNPTETPSVACCPKSQIFQGDCCPGKRWDPTKQTCCPAGQSSIKSSCCPDVNISISGVCCIPANFGGAAVSLDTKGNCCPTVSQTGGLCCDASLQDYNGACCLAPLSQDANKVCCNLTSRDCMGFCANDSTGLPVYITDPKGVCCLYETKDCAGFCRGPNNETYNLNDTNGVCCAPADHDCAGICFGPDPNCCFQYKDCGSCLNATSAGCGWCGTQTRGDPRTEPGCLSGDALDSLSQTGVVCQDQGFFWSFPEDNSAIINTEGEFGPNGGSPFIQPQTTRVTLVPGDPLDVPIQVRVPANIPLDLFLIQDLSYSFLDDIPVLQSIIADFITEMKKVVEDTQVGFGSFIDKPIAPFGYGAGGYDYPYRIGAPISSDSSKVVDYVLGLDSANLGGGYDIPESMLEGIQRALKMRSETGWRTNVGVVSRVIVLITDAPYHQAGDVQQAIQVGGYSNLLVGGPWTTNPGDGTIAAADRGDGVQAGLVSDYPSVDQVIAAFNDPSFPVTIVCCTAQTGDDGTGQKLYSVNASRDAWTYFTQKLGRGLVEPLSSNSNDLIASVKQALTEATQTISLRETVGENSPYVITVDPITPSVYTNSTPGKILNFTVHLQWNGEPFTSNPAKINLDAYYPIQGLIFEQADILVYFAQEASCSKCLDFAWDPASEECDPTSEEWLSSNRSSQCCTEKCTLFVGACNVDDACNPGICTVNGSCVISPVTCEADNRTCGFNSCSLTTGECQWKCSSADCCDDKDACTIDVCDGLKGICDPPTYNNELCTCSYIKDCLDCVTTDFTSASPSFIQCKWNAQTRSCQNLTFLYNQGYCENSTMRVNPLGVNCNPKLKVYSIANATLCAPAKANNDAVIIGASVAAGGVVLILLIIAAIFLVLWALGVGKEATVTAINAGAGLASNNPLYAPGGVGVNPMYGGA